MRNSTLLISLKNGAVNDLSRKDGGAGNNLAIITVRRERLGGISGSRLGFRRLRRSNTDNVSHLSTFPDFICETRRVDSPNNC